MNKNTLKADKKSKPFKMFDITSNNENDCISFSFRYFINRNITKNDEFNNAYKNEREAIESVKGLFKILKSCCEYKVSELPTKLGRIFHYHKLENKEYEITKNILHKYFGVSETRIETLGDLHQIGFEDGERAVFYISGSVFYLLFLDPNHMIYKDSSRNLKEKQHNNTPSIFSDL